MKKTGFRAFTCSFVFSLFIVFAVDKAIFHGKPSKDEELKISNKNIVLFINNSAPLDQTKSLPIKKISLSIIPEVEKQSINEAPLQDADNLVDDIENSIVMAENNFEINLPVYGEENIAEAGEIHIVTANDTPIIMDNFEQMINAKKVVYEGEDETAKVAEVIDAGAEKVAEIIDTAVEPPFAEATDNVIEPHFAEAIYEPKQILIEPEKAPEEKAIIVASNTPSKPVIEDEDLPYGDFVEPIEADDADFLIPLEKSAVSATAKARKNNIEIIKEVKENQVALADKNVPIKSMTKHEDPKEEPKAEDKSDFDDWKRMSETREENHDSPWLVAKGTKHPRNNFVANDEKANMDSSKINKILHGQGKKRSRAEVKVAAEMIDNILIPIPEEILNDENLTPQLVSSKKNENLIEKKDDVQILDSQGKNIKKADEQNKGIINSITSMFSGSSRKTQKDTADEDDIADSNKKVNRTRISETMEASKILPTEMRLSFQPNRAEISGNTLRWIQAFAKKAVDDQTTALEIRIDGTSAQELQQKRLNLLHNILTNRGVEYSKIKVVFTAREPNSFILRTIKINEKVNGGIERNTPANNNGYYMQW